jgi:hypothetical protein
MRAPRRPRRSQLSTRRRRRRAATTVVVIEIVVVVHYEGVGETFRQQEPSPYKIGGVRGDIIGRT